MRYLVNNYILDTDRFELTLNGKLQSIEPQAIELLMLLIENRGRMLSKEEIYNTIWKNRVVSDSALSSRIKMIRQALGDDGRSQHTIRTIHGKGFRFIAEVEVSGEQNQANSEQLKGREAQPQQPAQPEVAVLPFINLSNDSEQEYFSDGITTDIISYLAKHRWLNVWARNTAFSYKGQSIDVRHLGKNFGVSYVVEGSVQRADNRVRISVNLIDAHSGHQLWGNQYDRDIIDIFSLQDEITKMIVARLEPEIGFSEREKIVRSRPVNLKAWDCYHLGIYHFFKFTDADNLEAQSLLMQSRELDPNFGEALVWWAYSVVLGMVYWSTEPSDALLDEALSVCDKALSLDQHNATFHALKARVLLSRREYKKAIIENEKAIELNPTFAAAHCGLGDSLAYEGQYQEAINCFEKAISLSPNDPQLWAFYSYGALALVLSSEYNKAVEWAETACTIPNCQYWAVAHKMVALAYLQNEQACSKEKKKLLNLNPKFTLAFAKEKLFYLKRQDQIEHYLIGLSKAGLN